MLIVFANVLLGEETGAPPGGLRGNPVQIGNGPATVSSRSVRSWSRGNGSTATAGEFFRIPAGR